MIRPQSARSRPSRGPLRHYAGILRWSCWNSLRNVHRNEATLRRSITRSRAVTVGGDKSRTNREFHYSGAPERKVTIIQTCMPEIPFLQDLTPEQHDLLAALFVPVELPGRSVIFRQGQEAAFMYLLVEGGVSLRYKPYDGPRITLTRLHAGDVFGWSSVVGNDVYTADAIVTIPARALRARGMDIRELCVRFPTTGSQILEKLALAVSPRWLNSREQIQHLLKRATPDFGRPDLSRMRQPELAPDGSTSSSAI